MGHAAALRMLLSFTSCHLVRPVPRHIYHSLPYLTLPTVFIYLFIMKIVHKVQTKKIKTKGAGSLNKLPTAEACTW